ISRLARVWRWCKRNQAVAALSTTLLLSLILGSTISTFFAVKAYSRADAAEGYRKLAEERRQQAEGGFEELEGVVQRVGPSESGRAVNPNDLSSLLDRGRSYALLGMWKQASDDYRRAGELRPADVEQRLIAAALLLQIGDAQGYDGLRRNTISEFRDTSNIDY